MNFFRSYFSKQATLIRDNQTNNSKNPIIELTYGGSLTSSNTQISRYIFQIDLEDIKRDIIENELSVSNFEKHTLNIKNVLNIDSSSFVDTKIQNSKRTSNAELIIFALEEDFVEGSGFDYIYNPQRTIGTLNTSPSNWFFREQPNVKWSIPGIYSETPNNIIATVNIAQGTENIVADITNYINGILFSGKTNYGLGIGYVSSFENATTSDRFVVSYFSKFTQTFFEPYVESVYNKIINENRCCFKLDEPNNLFLISKKALDSVERVDIYDYEDNLFSSYTGSSIVKLDKNTFKVEVSVPSSLYPDNVQFTDTWFYTFKGINKKEEKLFNIAPENLFDFDGDNEFDFRVLVSGLKNNSTISRQEGKKRINIKNKIIKDSVVRKNENIESIEYKIFIRQNDNEIPIIPFTPVNKVDNKYFIDIDFSWFIPQNYFLQFRIVQGDLTIYNDKEIKFRVLSS